MSVFKTSRDVDPDPGAMPRRLLKRNGPVRRCFSVLLSLCMLLTCMPPAVFAEGDEESDIGDDITETVTLTLVYDPLYQFIHTGTPDVIMELAIGTEVDLTTLEIPGHENDGSVTWLAESGNLDTAITAPFTMDADKTIYYAANLGGGDTVGGGSDVGGSNEQTEKVTLTLVYDQAWQSAQSGTPDVTKKYDKGTVVDLSTVDNTVPWYEDADFKNPITAPFTINEDKTIYAGAALSGESGEQAEPVTLTLVYDQMWHDYNWMGLGSTPDVTIEYSEGTEVDLTTLDDTVDKWYEDSDFKNEITEPFTMNEDKTVYAEANLGGDSSDSSTPIKLKLTLVYDNGTPNVTKVFNSGRSVDLTTLDNTVTWYEDSDFKNEIAEPFTMDADKIVYARTASSGGSEEGKVTLTLVYDPLWKDIGGDNPDVTMEFDTGETVNLTTLKIPGHESEDPVSWLTESGNADTAITEITMDDNKTLYAGAAISGAATVSGGDSSNKNSSVFHLSFHSNGGSYLSSMTFSKPTVVDFDSAELKPTREGYTFVGWFTDFDLKKIVSGKQKISEETTVVAGWAYNFKLDTLPVNSASSNTSVSNSANAATNTDLNNTGTNKSTGNSIAGSITDSKVETITTENGTTAEKKTVNVTSPDGSTGTIVTTTDANGVSVTKAEVTLSENAVTEAAASNETVTLPVSVAATKKDSSAAAPTVAVAVPENAGSVKIEIPVENVTKGTVAILMHEDGTEEIVRTSTVTDNGVVLTVSGNVTVKLVDNSKDFSDSPAWASDYIDFVSSRELFRGTSDTTFSPNSSTTRAQLMTVLARLDGKTANSTADGMSWAVNAGISDGSNPNGSISRQQLATMLYRYAGEPATNGSISSFPDAANVGSYAETAMCWAVSEGIISGTTSGTLNPAGPATRAQVAAMVSRYVSI
jgi:uncharacterized repeat protein (TIGR02543 family)